MLIGGKCTFVNMTVDNCPIFSTGVRIIDVRSYILFILCSRINICIDMYYLNPQSDKIHKIIVDKL